MFWLFWKKYVAGLQKSRQCTKLRIIIINSDGGLHSNLSYLQIAAIVRTLRLLAAKPIRDSFHFHRKYVHKTHEFRLRCPTYILLIIEMTLFERNLQKRRRKSFSTLKGEIIRKTVSLSEIDGQNFTWFTSVTLLRLINKLIWLKAKGSAKFYRAGRK